MPKCSNHCNKKNCIFFRKAEIPAVVANDDITPPRNGDFCNMLVVYQATGNAYLFASDGIPTLLSSNDYRKLSNLPSINGVTIIGDLTLSDIGVTQLVEEEADARRDADNDLQEQIDTIAASSDVVDIVGTYQELMQYDTSHLTINDVIKVLDDETENDATTYYRWTNDGWLFIGQEGPYYTKSQVNELLAGKLDDDALDDYYDKTETDALLTGKADVSDLAAKQDKLIAGANITIDQATNTISATVPSLDNYYTKQETYSQTEVDSLISGVEADIPTATSQLTNDSGFLTTLPIATSQILGGIKVGSGLSVAPDGTLSADAQHIDIDTALSTTSTNPVENRVITNALNNKANLSDIPTVPTNVSAFYNDAGYVTSSTIAQNYYNKTETYNQSEVDGLISGVSADIPTKTSDLTNDGANGTSTYVELSQLATVATSGSYNDLTDKPTVMTGLVEMSYGEANAWAKFIAAYQAKQIVYCRASSAANPASGSQTRKAFMAYVNNADNPTSVEFQYVRSVSSKTASQPVDQVFVYTLTSANGGTWTVTTRDMGPKLAQGTNTTVSYSNGTYTISATQPTVPTKTSDLTNDGSDGTSTYVEADQLATVATSGSYNDLSNKPTIPAAQVNSDWDATSGVAQILNKPTLATVATSGLYSDLTGTPNIPIVNNATLTIQRNGTSVGTFTANASSNKTINITVPTTAADVSALPASTKYGASITVTIDPSDYKVTTTLKDQDGNRLGAAQTIDLPLESVVVNGSYDNTNKKIVLTLQSGSTIDIPVADLVAGLQSEITSSNKLASDLVDDTNQTHKFMTSAEKTKLSGIAAGAEVNVQSDWDQTTATADDYIKNKPALATVATSGSYNDLSNRPTIPTVNNATLTIQKNGAGVATFTANASSNVTANITVPTKTSDITNDSNFVASGDLATVATSGSYNDLSDKPTIPAKQVFYGTSGSSGGSSSKAVACSGFTYAEGNVIYVTFSNADTYSGDYGMTMNVNSTGAKTIFTQTTSGGGVQNDHKWAAGETVCFVCHNNHYLMVEAAMATTTTSGLMSVNDKNKLDGVAAGAEANVQSDWNVTDTASDAFIKNKPTLATVATSGAYSDLSGKPTIPTAGTITSGSTGYATGGDVYNAIGDVESILSTLNIGGGAQ